MKFNIWLPTFAFSVFCVYQRFTTRYLGHVGTRLDWTWKNLTVNDNKLLIYLLDCFSCVSRGLRFFSFFLSFYLVALLIFKWFHTNLQMVLF